MSEPSIIGDSAESLLQRVDARRVLALALASQGYPQIDEGSLLRDIEEGGYTLRLTTDDERRMRNDPTFAARPPEVDAEGEDIRVCAKRLAEYLEHRVGCPALRNISKRDECVCGLNALLDRAIPAATEAERE